MSVFLISSFLHGLHSTIGCYISYFSQLVGTWKFHDRTVVYFLFQVFKILQNQYVKFHQASVLTICMLIICLITTKKKPTWMIIEILLIRTVSSSVQLRIKISKLIWKPTKAYKYECGSSEQEK